MVSLNKALLGHVLHFFGFTDPRPGRASALASFFGFGGNKRRRWLREGEREDAETLLPDVEGMKTQPGFIRIYEIAHQMGFVIFVIFGE